MKIRTNPLSNDLINIYSLQVRKLFNVSDEEAFPIIEFLEFLELKQLLFLFPLEDDNDYLEDDESARYDVKNNCIYIRESVFKEIEEKNYRGLFTLCHELFHFIQVKYLCFEFIELEDYLVKAYEDAEWQANTFASLLLLPKNKLFTYSKEETLERYKITEHCYLYRKLKFYRQKYEYVKKY